VLVCICIPNQVPFYHSKPIGRSSNPFVLFLAVAKVKTWWWFVSVSDIMRVNVARKENTQKLD